MLDLSENWISNFLSQLNPKADLKQTMNLLSNHLWVFPSSNDIEEFKHEIKALKDTHKAIQRGVMTNS